MRDDPFLTWITVLVSLGCLLLVSVLAAAGALADALQLGLSGGIVVCVAGLWGGLVQVHRRARRDQRDQLSAVERLVGLLRGAARRVVPA